MGLRASARPSGARACSRRARSSSSNSSFETLGVHRLEARAAVLNSRGNGALLKIGAVKEGVLRKSLERNGQFLDQALYAILDSDWRAWEASRIVASEHVH